MPAPVRARKPAPRSSVTTGSAAGLSAVLDWTSTAAGEALLTPREYVARECLRLSLRSLSMRDAVEAATQDSSTGASVAPDPRRWWALAVLAASQLMIVLDASIVNIALPSAQA